MAKSTFHCENCQRKVSPNDKICPHCGSFFTDVKCPRCKFSGHVELFLNGCPQCGYLKNRPKEEITSNFEAIERISLSPDRLQGIAKKRSVPLSRVVFWTIFGILLVLFIILFQVFSRL